MYNKIVRGVVSALVFSYGLVGLTDALVEAAPADNKTVKTEAAGLSDKAPIVIEADHLSFSDNTGDVQAEGNVKVKQLQTTILTETLQGNTKTAEVWINGTANLLQPDSQLVGEGLQYNYKTNSGSMQQANGLVGKQHVHGEKMTVAPGKVMAFQGTMTQCDAKVPDYHISADRIEIWPGKKMVAYNAKFWIKNMVIYSTSRYQRSLVPGEDESGFPKVNYNNSDGVTIKQHFEHPMSDTFAAYVDASVFSKKGIKASYGVIDRQKNYSLGVTAGEFEDKDDKWITKEPELQFRYHPHRLGQLPVSYTFSANYGKWADDDKDSWHQDYSLYFTRDTIHLTDTLTWDIGAGLSKTIESYNQSTTDSWRWDTTLKKTWAPRWTGWIGYHYVQNTSSVFDYNNPDMNRELVTGVSYKVDRLNTLTIERSYDLDNKRVYDLDYTWKHNLHCWDASITYRAERHQIKWSVSTARW